MKPVPGIVTLLTDALAAARRGDVRALCMVSVNPDGMVDTSLAIGTCSAGDLFAATSALAAEILDDMRAGASGLEPEDDSPPLAKTKPATN